MKRVMTLMLVGAAVLAVSPAWARQPFEGHAGRHTAHCRMTPWEGQECRPAYLANSHNVYSYDGRLIGRDPDPNIRRSLRDEDARYRWR